MSNDLQEQLRADGLLRDAQAVMIPLAGGVSADIVRVDDGDRTFVVKRVLAKLRGKRGWYADTSRINTEIHSLEYFADALPGITPRIIASRPEHHYVVMEFLDETFANWKALLMRGQCLPHHARIAGNTLGKIHRLTWNRRELEAQFNAQENFKQLRLDPYLAVLPERHPDLRELIENEIRQFRTHRFCVIHGDYSPKNLLFCAARMVVLDWEVACYGDPAFDIGFLLNHLILKAVYRPQQAEDYLDLCRAAWQAYAAELGGNAAGVELRLARLLPLLMLARVDGKSPVEYLIDNNQPELVRALARQAFVSPFTGIETACTNWIKRIKEWKNDENHTG